VTTQDYGTHRSSTLLLNCARVGLRQSGFFLRLAAAKAFITQRPGRPAAMISKLNGDRWLGWASSIVWSRVVTTVRRLNCLDRNRLSATKASRSIRYGRRRDA